MELLVEAEGLIYFLPVVESPVVGFVDKNEKERDGVSVARLFADLTLDLRDER